MKKPREPKPQGTGNPKHLEPVAPFTVDELRAVIERTKRNEWAMPSDAEIENLASILRFWKQHFYSAQEARALNAKLAAAEAAIRTLIKIMPEVYEYRMKAANAGDPFSKPMAKSARKLLVALDYSDIDPHWQPAVLSCLHRESVPEQVNDWRWLIKVLPVHYERAIRSANPSATVGRSKTGPLARFLEEVIPKITGEAPTATAIGNQFIKKKTASDISEAPEIS